MTYWQDFPFRMEVKKGEKKAICSCGKTQNPPFCDGSHKGSDKVPYRLSFEEDKRISICGCGKSKKQPFCDGSHGCKSN